MTEEDDTVEDVSRHADAEDDGVDVAVDNILCCDESFKGDDIIRVVPGKKTVAVA